MISLNRVSKVKSISNHPNERLLSVYLEKGVIPFEDVSEKRTNGTSDNLDKYQLVDIGDFVLNNQQAWRGSVGVSNYRGIISPAYIILEIIIGLQPAEGANIAGIRRWPAAYLPKIFEPSLVDRVMDIEQHDAEVFMRKLAREEGIFAGVSSGGAAWAAYQIAKEHPEAVIAFIVCDRGDRYLSTGLFGVKDDA